MSDSTEVTAPWSGMTRDAIKAALAAKTLASGGDTFGPGEFYVVEFSGIPMFVPAEHFDGFAVAILKAD